MNYQVLIYNRKNMKTAEEIAFRDKIDQVDLEELTYVEFDELITEAIKIGKANGNKEVRRWVDPKEEPPINQDIVLVKTDNDCYATAYFHGEVSGFICYGDDAYIEFGNIIGWRPIE